MGQDNSEARRDFFISYTESDQQWAEWIAMQLDQAGYTLFIQAWDFRPGSNIVAEIDNAAKRAERTLLVLSPAYLESGFAFSEWAVAFRRDPRGIHRNLLPVRIELCEVDGLLGQMVYIDLFQLSEEQAKERLLSGVERGRVKSTTASFPEQNIRRIAFPGALPVIWNIPYPRNPIFTGREQLLTRLADALQPGEAVALIQPQAISGLGGIGKTQIALEYAYRYSQNYQAVLWTLADTHESLVSGYLNIAELLNLSEKDEQDQSKTVQAVVRWLTTHTDWLLILDNADDLTLVYEFLPSGPAGHLLLTTRAQATGTRAYRLEVDSMERDVGALFLLRRAKLIASDVSLEGALASDVATAREVSEELGGHPLALDQAGAYIEETGCSLSDYLELFKQEQQTLLKRRGAVSVDHPQSVTTTFSLAFEKVQQRNKAAIELLKLSSFLAPDTIPLELIAQGAIYPGTVLEKVSANALQLDQTLAILQAYSLIQRDRKNRTLSIHRLVQAVLKQTLNDRQQRLWAERIVEAVNMVFPSEVNFVDWFRCRLYLPHAQVCAKLIDQFGITFLSAVQLLSKIGTYLINYDQYAEAEPLLLQALMISERVFGVEHSQTAYSLNSLGNLYQGQEKYTQAKQFYQRALTIYEQKSGQEYNDIIYPLIHLGRLHVTQGQYREAELYFLRGLPLSEKVLGSNHDFTGGFYHNLGVVYYEQGKYSAAEPLLQRALAICEQKLGPEHLNTAHCLRSLAKLYHQQGKSTQEELFSKRALAIYEQHQMSHYIILCISSLVKLYQGQDRHREAEFYYQCALSTYDQWSGPPDPQMMTVLKDYVSFLVKGGRVSEAEQVKARYCQLSEAAESSGTAPLTGDGT